MVRGDSGSNGIDIRLRHLSQLVNSLDPSPFREGDLTVAAEEYIVRKAKEQPEDRPVRIVIHLPADEGPHPPPSEIAAAVAGHFATCAAAEAKSFREAIRTWRHAALIGFAVLSVCLFLAWHIANTLPPRPLTRILQESFVILGWVSIWKPIETFLYELLPPDRRNRRRLLLRLSTAEVVVRQEGSGTPVCSGQEGVRTV